MIKIDGNEIMKTLEINPSKKIGLILDILLAEVLDNPEKNNKKYLKERALILGSITDKELESLAAKSKKEINSIITKEDHMTKEKYWLV